MKSDIHIVRHDRGWAVKKEGASRASVVRPTKADAVDKGREQARREKAELVIHGKDGRTQDSDSYGRDPCPPKDRVH